jgi:flagellar biosynthetic protein FliR
MPELPLVEVLQLDAVTLALVISRVSGIFLFAPIWSSRLLPVRARLYLALAVTALLASVVPAPQSAVTSLVELAVLIAGELAIGLVIGTILQITIQGLQLAGQAVGTQIGFALANVVNPQLDDQVSTFSIFYAVLGTLIFLAVGGDRQMLAALLETFAAIPLGDANYNESTGELILAVFQQSTILAVRVAAPVTFSLILAEIALGFVSRTVPQLNLLSIGFSLRIFVGLLVGAISCGAIAAVFVIDLSNTFEVVYEALSRFVPAQE